MSQQGRVRNEQESAPELVYSIDQLEELVGNGKRVPMSNLIMVSEQSFIELLEDVRSTIPVEIREAQRLLKERERVIGEAQEEASRIVSDAQRRASVLVSDHTIINEAKQVAEEMLRSAEKTRQEERGRMEVYFQQQIEIVRRAALASMSDMESTVERTLDSLDRAEHVLKNGPDSD